MSFQDTVEEHVTPFGLYAVSHVCPSVQHTSLSRALPLGALLFSPDQGTLVLIR